MNEGVDSIFEGVNACGVDQYFDRVNQCGCRCNIRGVNQYYEGLNQCEGKCVFTIQKSPLPVRHTFDVTR